MPVPLRSLSIEGFTSIERLTLELSTDVTLLVGGNGAGKSNLVSAFELMGRLLDDQLNSYLLEVGGFARVLHRGRSAGRRAEFIQLEAWGVEHEGLSNGYRATIMPVAEDRGAVSETSFFFDRNRYESPYSTHIGTASESQLRAQAAVWAREQYVLEVLSGCRVFHFDNTGDDAPPKKRSDVADSQTLHQDGRNLAAVLLRMRSENPENYRRIVRVVQSVAPFFGDFVFDIRGDSVLLRWQETGIDGVFSAGALSDGTLRFICLATLLLQPTRSATIVLDEPELGLHPFAVYQLADLLRRASEGGRIVAATQSVTLLGQFSINEVAIVDRSAHGTTVSRPDAANLQDWLQDYSLGELWEKNVLGGRPGKF